MSKPARLSARLSPPSPKSPENIGDQIRHRPYALAAAKRRVQDHPYILVQLPDMRFNADQIAGRVACQLRKHAQARATQHAIEHAEYVAAAEARRRRGLERLRSR